VSAAASAVDEQATGPLFSDRTEDTDKTITRYSVLTYCLQPCLFLTSFSMVLQLSEKETGPAYKI